MRKILSFILIFTEKLLARHPALSSITTKEACMSVWKLKGVLRQNGWAWTKEGSDSLLVLKLLISPFVSNGIPNIFWLMNVFVTSYLCRLWRTTLPIYCLLFVLDFFLFKLELGPLLWCFWYRSLLFDKKY